MSSSVSSSPNNTADSSNEETLWRHCTKLGKSKERGGNTKFLCNFCKVTYHGSYSRVKAHLLHIRGEGIRICERVTPEILAGFKREMEEIKEKSAPKNVPLPSTRANVSSKQGIDLLTGDVIPSQKRKKGENSTVEETFRMEARNILDGEIARAFYTGGIPFHFARNPHYRNSYTMAANSKLTGYVPPTYEALRTTLLAKERANIECLLQPIKGTWKQKGVSVVSDGWSDSQRRPLINFMAVSEGAPMFLKAVNCEGKIKDKYFISDLMIEAIKEVGRENVVQVVTDNAPVCKAAGQIVEAQYPHIFWTPCVVHTLNLALKNICAAKNTERNDLVYEKCHWITEITDRAMEIKNFILNHSMRLAIYNQFATLKLLSIAETRFASMIVMLKRFRLMKHALGLMVISDQWNSYREDDVVKAQSVRNTILDSSWWDKVDYILDFTGPIYDMIRFADTDAPSLHLAYEMWDSMIEKVKNIIFRHEGEEDHHSSPFYEVIYEILVDRWNKSTSPLHCLAHSLNPKYYSTEWLNESPNRSSPDHDVELSEERNKCFRRLFPDNDVRKAVNVEYARFSGAMDVFGEADSLSDRSTMEPRVWWQVHGASAPNLRKIALKVLGQPCSSSCCERNWSVYSFIHSIRRNKIQPERAESLVFVHTNLRLLSRKKELYTTGETRMWDVGGDSFEPLDGAEELEIANLSLDEPEIEAMLFQDVQIDVGNNVSV